MNVEMGETVKFVMTDKTIDDAELAILSDINNIKPILEALITEANRNGFYAGCGAGRLELSVVPKLYDKYRAKLAQLKENK